MLTHVYLYIILILIEIFCLQHGIIIFSPKRLGESEDSRARGELLSLFFSEIRLNIDLLSSDHAKASIS